MKILVKTLTVKGYRNLTLIFLASVLVTLPVYFFGIPNGNDLPQHYQFALTFNESLRDGSFYPSFSSASNYGFGDLGVRFYPPFSYYVLVFFKMLIGDWFDASLITFVFWFCLGGIGIYFWAREWFGENASLLAGLIYVFAPYRVNGIYNAFMYAEFAASAILPFCFLFVTRICRRTNFVDVLGLAFFSALLVLTHLPLTVIGSLAMIPYLVFSLPKTKRIRVLARVGLAGSMGLLASSFYWVRMASELNFINHASATFTSKDYDFHSNFVAAFFYVSRIDYIERSIWFLDLMFLMTAFLFLPSALIFFFGVKESDKPRILAVVVLMIASVFMATPLSLPIWENFSLLQRVQFPWRWFTVISMCAALLTAAGSEKLFEYFANRMRPLALFTVGLMFSGGLFTFTQIIRPAVFLSRAGFENTIEKLSEAESYDCWWSVWANKSAFLNREKVSTSNRHINIERWQTTEKEFQISSGESQEARVAIFYYPYWEALVNGKLTDLKIASDGTILIPISQDETRVRLLFREPLRTRVANYSSVATWLILFSTAAFFGFRRRSEKSLFDQISRGDVWNI